MSIRSNYRRFKRLERLDWLGPPLARGERRYYENKVHGDYETESNSVPERECMLGTVLLILLILMLVGALPTWPHSRNWGYGPTGGVGVLLAVLVVLLLVGII
jgi:hypothetical protein